ncbi:hypothetical protein [Deinococcus apachensis]|uniref:hypothetical protein n=1 Tax=Deinococcus apachensis TaxID=309886 RepID=UPI00035F9660|nr:hypothetical protein [Deinococcus apachensis]
MSCGNLREGVYPVNVTAEHPRHLTSDGSSADLDELLVFGNPTSRVVGILNRWRLWVTQNPD